MDRLNSVKPKDRTSAAWANAVVAELRRQNIIPGKGLKKTVTSKGTRLELDLPDEKGGGGGEGVLSDVVPCLVTGGDALNGYSVNLYANGFTEARTGRGTLYLPEVAAHTSLPTDTSILAHICEATFTQSDEEEDNDEMNPEEEEEES